MSARRPLQRDPDVAALLEAAGGIYDAATLVINQARDLNALYRKFDGGGSSPRERLKQLASLKGFSVCPMSLDGTHDTRRDAVVLMRDSGVAKGGQIFYNPLRSQGRIAHEIAHSFFPQTSGGARFREMLDESSEETSELESLCHIGAAELLMPEEDFRSSVAGDWSFNRLHSLEREFGASTEATVFRLATANPGQAVAGLARYRHTKADAQRVQKLKTNLQARLFDGNFGDELLSIAPPKYRRQSFHPSLSFPKELFIPWNKSFDESSCGYEAAVGHNASGDEPLPSRTHCMGRLEAMRAPYQGPDADVDHPDILFLWKAA